MTPAHRPRRQEKNPPLRSGVIRNAACAAAVFALIESAHAVQIEPLGKAIAAALGTTKAFKNSMNLDGKTATSFYYSKDSRGAPEALAFIEKGIYPPNCTHTWVVGVEAKTQKVKEVRVVEMSCPHAFPTKSSSFLAQYKGKGPADAAKLHDEIDTIAKATGSSKLATDAVKRSIEAAVKVAKGQKK